MVHMSNYNQEASDTQCNFLYNNAPGHDVIMQDTPPLTARVFAILLLAFLLTSCDVFESDSGQLDGTIESNTLVLNNSKNETVYYFAVGRAKVASILWHPGFDGTNDIKAVSSKSIPLDQIDQEENEDELIVYWWTYRDIKSLPQQDAVQNFIVTL